VEFLGRIPEEDVAGRFAEADLFLNPDLTQPAFGLVALEAMLQGTPVLASWVGAMPEVIGEAGGWLVRPGDVKAWRTALEERLAAPEELETLRQQGRRARQSALRRFSLERMISAIEAVYSRTRTPGFQTH
jgi:glycosyltransferase involved in cell wall biosynthesis